MTATLKNAIDAFGRFRAEWDDETLGKYYVEPPYFSQLCTPGCALLVGGRGTGKTTALKALCLNTSLTAAEVDSERPYAGVYLRINKNRVPAFEDPRLGDDGRPAFIHYFNLLICQQIVQLAQSASTTEVPGNLFDRMLSSLGIKDKTDRPDVAIDSAISQLELFVNNPRRLSAPLWSMPEAPVRALIDDLARLPALQELSFYVCIDEYENLLDWQQSIINTYVKHAEPSLSFKLGVRPYGMRSLATLDSNDLLMAPADYRRIDISEQDLDEFIVDVAEERLRVVTDGEATTLDRLLPSLSWDEEADLLGADRHAESVRTWGKSAPEHLREWIISASTAELAFAEFRRNLNPSLSLSQITTIASEQPAVWRNQKNNYGHAMLFWLSQGRRGARVRKYYCGSRTLVGLAAGNVRFLLELMHQALSLLDSDANISDGVPAELQTLAARHVAKGRLDQLAGIPEHGVQLKRLILGLGKVFFELARNPVGSSPEQNTFVVNDTENESANDIVKLLQAGVAHLALEARPRTKATVDTEIRDEEYRLHPILVPFFEYSYRRKRRLVFDAIQLADLLRDPTSAIRSILDGRELTPVEEIPEQLMLFDNFFGGLS